MREINKRELQGKGEKEQDKDGEKDGGVDKFVKVSDVERQTGREMLLASV